MRLQNLLIIFVAIALPVMIILQVFIGYQIDTVNLRTQYDNKLLGATYDTMTAFQLNTTNNIYSTVSDTLIRDIEASINIFTMQFGSSFGKTGTSKSTILNYVPALLFTLYDGYYIYTPVTKEDGTLEHTLKPYVYYTKEYNYGTSSKMIINYSLDNYVVIYNYKNNEFTSKAGFLELTTSSKTGTGIYYDESTGEIFYNGIQIDNEEILTRQKYDITTGTTVAENITSTSAYNYYKEAYEFSKWYNDTIKDAFETGTENYNKLYISSNNSALPYAMSAFNNEKEKVIEDIITNNLMQTMDLYGRKSSIDFNMPKLTAEDWEKILHNVCVVSFVQGLPVGTAKYNNYVIVPSTENKQYISNINLFYVGTDGAYHRLDCEHIQGDNIIGYSKNSFSRQAVIYNNGNVFKKTDANGVERTVYYYPHGEMACYYCVVNASNPNANISSLSTKKKQAYYNALAREKYNLVKLSNYVNGSSTQTPQ